MVRLCGLGVLIVWCAVMLFLKVILICGYRDPLLNEPTPLFQSFYCVCLVSGILGGREAEGRREAEREGGREAQREGRREGDRE